MTDGDALLKAILANPAEDTPRLVYADWLTENGEPERAEFIRVQIKLARLPRDKKRPPDGSMELFGYLWAYHSNLVVLDAFLDVEHGNDCEYCLRNRQHELFKQSDERRSWFGPAFELTLAGTRWDRYLDWFSRGFVSALTCSWQDWLAHADTIRACQPIERVKLTTSNPYARLDLEWLAARWPGIAFELPEESERQYPTFTRVYLATGYPNRSELLAAVNSINSVPFAGMQAGTVFLRSITGHEQEVGNLTEVVYTFEYRGREELTRLDYRGEGGTLVHTNRFPAVDFNTIAPPGARELIGRRTATMHGMQFPPESFPPDVVLDLAAAENL